jgi:hypothetical protein
VRSAPFFEPDSFRRVSGPSSAGDRPKTQNKHNPATHRGDSCWESCLGCPKGLPSSTPAASGRGVTRARWGTPNTIPKMSHHGVWPVCVLARPVATSGCTNDGLVALWVVTNAVNDLFDFPFYWELGHNVLCWTLMDLSTELPSSRRMRGTQSCNTSCDMACNATRYREAHVATGTSSQQRLRRKEAASAAAPQRSPPSSSPARSRPSVGAASVGAPGRRCGVSSSFRPCLS